ncbi:MAG: YebC/PmpR family DNA-binding transcriptional regulator [Verrucomicrobiales bacterium]|jgi:YebC/PmpR family DNA-binding regulatory protein|nr:YebC/PmpR family DNA-binding transcriptional regulator [Verrucomicrobiales bacterium]
MAGHSHAANVARRKNAVDAVRAKIFSKFSREITVAAKLGGGDPNFNPRLRAAISAARGESMPNDKIDHAVKKGVGGADGANYEQLTYEGYGPGGVALLVETLSDNKNRTAAEIRAVFTKFNGSLGAPGSVAWMFKKKALFMVSGAGEDTVLEATLDAGPDDLRPAADGQVELIAAPEKFDALEQALKAAGLTVSAGKLTFIPDNSVSVTDPGAARALLTLIEKLEDHDDVQNVHANYDLPEEILNQINRLAATP